MLGFEGFGLGRRLIATRSKRMAREALEPGVIVGCRRDGEAAVGSSAAVVEETGWDRSVAGGRGGSRGHNSLWLRRSCGCGRSGGDGAVRSVGVGVEAWEFNRTW